MKNATGKRFARLVVDKFGEHEICCDSMPRWEFVFEQLRSESDFYDAIVVVLTNDDEWLCECAERLRELRKAYGDRMPLVRAYLHKSDDPDEADVIPIRINGFEEYYGLTDLPRLQERILAAGGRPS